MVKILAVGMLVAGWAMYVPVRMLEGERFVRVLVVSVIVAMPVFVFECLVVVLVLVPLGQVQDGTDAEQSGSRQQAPVEDSLTQDARDGRADERSRRKHRARSTRADAPLC